MSVDPESAEGVDGGATESANGPVNDREKRPATGPVIGPGAGPAEGPANGSANDPEEGPAKLLLVGSNGGHLAQLLALEPWWRDRERTWVTFNTEDARSKLREERVEWAYHPTTRNIPNLLRNLRLAVTVLRRTRPDVVVSTGAGVALPFFVLARLRRIPTVYLEVYDRLDTATLTGRLCRPFTTLFCVQWEEQQRLYKGSQVVGTLL